VGERDALEHLRYELLGSITPYDLRHTAITLQSKLAYSDWELADWAGTSERMINEVYRHRTDRIVRVRPLDLKPEAS
jgi:integrase